MPRGERIGDAYVKIHADGKGMRDDIRREWDPVIKGAGKDHGKTYADAFNDELDRRGKANILTFAGEINKSLGRVKAGQQFTENFTAALEDLRDRVGREYGPAIGQRLAEGIRQKMITGAIQTRKDYLAEISDLTPALTQIITDIEKENERLVASMNSQFKELEDQVDRLVKGNAKWGESTHSVRLTMDRLHESMEGVGTLGREQRAEFARMRLSLIRLSPALERTNRQWVEMGENVGRLTGRGSRNNFLNFIGSVNRNLTRLVGSFIFGSARAVTSVGKLTLAWKEFLDPAFAKEAVKNFASFFSNLANNAIALGLALGIAALTSGILVAALSGLAAIVTSLAATIGFAFVGAVSAAVGAMVPLIAGVGVVTAAFMSLSDAQKEALKADVQPLVDAFKALGDSAADVLFRDVGKWARMAAPLIEKIEPAVIGVARAIRDTLGDAIKSAAESPAFERFLDRMNVFLPNATRKLGDIFTNVFAGMGGVFTAMLPLVNRFLGWLEDITGEFAAWANSRQGQQELMQFFEDAGDSVSALGDFLGDATRLLGVLLGAARREGDAIFRDMAEAIGRMVDYLRSPEGQAAMRDWLEFGRDLADAIGDTLVAVFNLINALDNPSTRGALLAILDGFADIVNFVSAHPDLMFILLGPIGVTVGAIVKIKDAISGIINLVTGDSSVGSWVAEIAEGARDGVEAAAALKGSLDQVTGAVTESTRAMALQRLQEDNLIATGRSLGLTSRQLVAAALGNKGASQQVAQAIQNQFNKTGLLSQAQMDLAEDLGLTAAELARGRREILANTVATQNFAGKLRGLPRKVRVEIREDGIRPTIAGIARVIARAKELAPNLSRRQIKTIVEASGIEVTSAKLRKILRNVKDLDKAEGHPTIDPDVKPFDSQLANVDRRLSTTDKKTTKPKADLDPRPFNLGADRIEAVIREISGKTIKPSAEINTLQFYNQRAALITAMNNLPTAYYNVLPRIIGPGPGSNTGGNNGNNDVTPRETSTGRQFNIPSITVVEAADGRATAREMLNHLAALSY